MVLTVGVGELEYVREGRPVWDEVSMAVAEAIRSGKSVARVPVPEPLNKLPLTHATIGQWLYQLRRDVPSIHIELRDLVKNAAAEQEIHEDGQKLIEEGRRRIQQKGKSETLHKTDEFDWALPTGFKFGALAIPETSAEKSKQLRTARVLTYTEKEKELETLWEYATPMQRLLLLLGLNCGFSAKEIATLEMDDVHLRTKPPNERDLGISSTDLDSWILRIRNKTRVYGEWKLSDCHTRRDI